MLSCLVYTVQYYAVLSLVGLFSFALDEADVLTCYEA